MKRRIANRYGVPSVVSVSGWGLSVKIIFLSILSVLFSAVCFAGDIEPVFEALKSSAVNYEPDGAVCEQVARLRLQEDYPDKDFLLATGIEYSTGGQTLGELDLVVINRTTQKVVLVMEVKCWKNYGQALDKAKAQRDRFTWNLTKYPHQIRFTTYSDLHLRPEQFEGNATVFRSLSHAGGIRHGFDMELGFTLSELRDLRMKLLKCQAWGGCPRPE
ncbi:hypothetical protein [Bdellovibrio sp.]|uniref:hypothetical protein n=1 Tax=Bdellovibrio sp. TaxID=28201 RepID=UPI0039E65879